MASPAAEPERPASPTTPASAPLSPRTADPLLSETPKVEKGPFGDPTPSESPSTRPPSLPTSRPQTAASSLRTGHYATNSLDAPAFPFGMDTSSFSKRTFNARRRQLGTSDAGMSSQVLSHYSRAPTRAPRMKSNMLPDGQGVEKPWLEKKDARQKVSTVMVYILFFLGIAGGAVQCYFRYASVVLDNRPLCLVMEENFDSEDSAFGPNGNFMREVEMGGFGNGQFEMTTASNKNSYVRDGHLYLVPTLTAEEIGEDKVFDGHVYNITGCTFNLTRPDAGHITSENGTRYFDEVGYAKSCSAVSNSTNPQQPIINPIQSARITTQHKTSIRFGRVEVRAKMAAGDWLWPAIWMFPRDRVYGQWPRSGEIDMVETRGNSPRYTNRGSNSVQGSLNWGPSMEYNSVEKTYSWWTEKRHSFADSFHTYVLEWTEEFMRIYVDTRVHPLLDIRFDKPFFDRGDYPHVTVDDGRLVPIENPWVNGSWAAPFDQDFFLVMNLAVGGSNGWFPDGQGDKPWLNMGTNPMKDFISSKGQWMPTWSTNPEERAMVVDYVKMYKHC